MRIGRITRQITDSKRVEILSGTNQSRRIIISIFYPLSGRDTYDNGPTLSYMEMYHPFVEETISILEGMGVHNVTLRDMRTNLVFKPVESNGEKHSVLLLSPGFGVERDMYLFLIEKLVSNGYVVITIGAPYESVFTISPGGKLIEQSPKLAELTYTDTAAWNQLLETRTKDILAVIHDLYEFSDEESDVHGLLNLESIGVIGHSLGGAAAFEAAKQEPRIRMCIMLDASFQFIHQDGVTLDIPVLNMRQEASNLHLMKDIMPASLALEYIEGQIYADQVLTNQKTFVRVVGANHMSFSDVPLHFGVNEAKAVHDVCSDCILSFLNEYLNNQTGCFRSFIQAHPNEIETIDGVGNLTLTDPSKSNFST